MFAKELIKSFLFIFVSVIITMCDRGTVKNTDWELVSSGFDFPEGPAWNMSNTLYLSNCYGNWIAAITGDTVDTLAISSNETFTATNGLFTDNDGNIYACDFKKKMILEISESGTFNVLVSDCIGDSLNRPNDLVLDGSRNIYFTDPKSYGAEKPDGKIYRFNLDSEELSVTADSLDFPNGLGISPIDKMLYVSESAMCRILRFQIADDGSLYNREVFAELPGGDPDGLDFDVRGNLYAASFGYGSVFVISPEGKIIQCIKTPGKKPSNLEFGDSDLRTLFLTEVETNSVYKIRTRFPGQKKW